MQEMSHTGDDWIFGSGGAVGCRGQGKADKRDRVVNFAVIYLIPSVRCLRACTQECRVARRVLDPLLSNQIQVVSPVTVQKELHPVTKAN